MIYKYLVSYVNFENSSLAGCGRVELESSQKIKNIEDVEFAEKTIAEKYGYEHVAIHNYILMSKRLNILADRGWDRTLFRWF